MQVEEEPKAESEASLSAVERLARRVIAAETRNRSVRAFAGASSRSRMRFGGGLWFCRCYGRGAICRR